MNQQQEEQGGSYIVDAHGNRRRVSGTEDHPAGNRPRAADGTPLGADGKPITEAEAGSVQDAA